MSSHQAGDLGAGDTEGNMRRSRQPRHAPRPEHAHVLPARALITARNHIDHAVTAHRPGAEASGEDPPDQEGLACRSRQRCGRQPAGHPVGGEHVTGARNDPPPHRYRIRVRGRRPMLTERPFGRGGGVADSGPADGLTTPCTPSAWARGPQNAERIIGPSRPRTRIRYRGRRAMPARRASSGQLVDRAEDGLADQAAAGRPAAHRQPRPGGRR